MWTPYFTNFGSLTDTNGNPVCFEHGGAVRVATDLTTGKQYQRLAETTPGANAVARQTATQQLQKAGAVFFQSDASDNRGWYAPAVTPAAALTVDEFLAASQAPAK